MAQRPGLKALLLAAAGALAGSGCSTVGALLTGAPTPMASVQRAGLAFEGSAAPDVPARLRPGASGEAALGAYAMGMSLAWVGGWIVGGPLWGPDVIASGYQPCRDAAAAARADWPAFRERLSQWQPLDEAHRLLAQRAGEFAPALRPLPAPLSRDAALAQAGALELQALHVFHVSGVELRPAQDPPDAECRVRLFVLGRPRALRVPDGALLDLRPAQPEACLRRRPGVPLAQLVRDAAVLQQEQTAATACAVEELLQWADQDWGR